MKNEFKVEKRKMTEEVSFQFHMSINHDHKHINPSTNTGF